MITEDGEKVCSKCGASYGQHKKTTKKPENNSEELPF